MGLGQLLFGFEGRISRKTFWLTSILTGLVLIFLMGLIVVGVVLQGNLNLSPEQIAQRVVPFVWIFLPFILAYYWISVALSAKRFHDLNMSAWYTWLLLPGLIFGLVAQTPNAVGGMYPAIVVIYAVTSLWMIVTLGFFKGTRGSNTYGPDPVT